MRSSWLAVWMLACGSSGIGERIVLPDIGGAEQGVADPHAVAGALRADAEQHAQDGVIDVAADLLARASGVEGSAEAHLEVALALADAHAFERARSMLTALALEPAVADRARTALENLPGEVDVAGDDVILGDELTIGPSAPPIVYELLGRSQMEGDPIEARRTFARGRSRIDASGMRIGLIATTAGAIDHFAVHDGRLIVARARELQLIGGYQSSGNYTSWLEAWIPGQDEPIVRVQTGHIVAFAAQGTRIAIVDRPIDRMIEPIQRTARIFDARTLSSTHVWPVDDAHAIAFAGDAILIASENIVRRYSIDGVMQRVVALSGETPGIMRVYRAGQGTRHDNVPTRYATRAHVLGATADGAIVAGASDGSMRIFPARGGVEQIIALPNVAPTAEPARELAARAIRIDGREARTVHGDGRIVHWDLARRRARVIFDGSCTDIETRNASVTEEIDASAAAYCRRTANAAIDATHAVLVTPMRGIRIRDVNGAPVSVIDTLLSHARLLDGDHLWLGGVEGEIERWDVRGRRLDGVAQ